VKRHVWVMAERDEWDEARELVTSALEAGADAVIVRPEHVASARELGQITIAVFGHDAAVDADVTIIGRGGEGDGTLEIPDELAASEDLGLARALKEEGLVVAEYVELRGPEYQDLARAAGTECDFVLLKGGDWKVIPLENIIAETRGGGSQVLAYASSAQESQLAFETLEIGADGVVLDAADASEIKEACSQAREKMGSVELATAKVVEVRQLSMGDRVCIDTCSMMKPGEGMLVGSQGEGLFLVQSESEDSPYVASRPFRVNAGPVHSYLLVGEKTVYLSELKAGDEVMVADHQGGTWPATVGRVKIERRPLMLVRARAGDSDVSVVLQNAETVKLVQPGGKSKAVTALEAGDEVLIYHQQAGRHFGTAVKETIVER